MWWRNGRNERTSGVPSVVVVGIGNNSCFGFRVQISCLRFAAVSLGGGAVKRGPGRRRLRRALVGAQEHLVLGGALRAAGLLLRQELLEPVGGEGESLALELHQVGVLQPGLGEAVPGRRAGPANSNNHINNAQTAPGSVAPQPRRWGRRLTTGNCSASSCRRRRRFGRRLGKVCSGRTLQAGFWTPAGEDLSPQRAVGR